MADTLTLDRIITACTSQGARVRLIGDDQQLAAVGAGGVLRDIATTHGAVRLDEVVRFDDPIEASASLALREGDASALGFYLDHDRVHTGDELTNLTEVLVAWQDHSEGGRECLMLAPTRDLVARLNHAARQTRLDGALPEAAVSLADGNQASVGDTILTRRNDRRLGVSSTDWVKNGDSWTITAVHDSGTIRARHLRSGLHVTLPAVYVSEHVELGYATTVHAAQGSTADVMHGVLTGHEDRQLLYTMLTRGRTENHLHLITEPTEAEEFLPGINEQLTAVETLDRIIGPDGAAVSATSELARATNPARCCTRPQAGTPTRSPRRLSESSAQTPTMRSKRRDPARSWLPGIPTSVSEHHAWSTYLEARADRVHALAETVRETSGLPPSLRRFATYYPTRCATRSSSGAPPEGSATTTAACWAPDPAHAPVISPPTAMRAISSARSTRSTQRRSAVGRPRSPQRSATRTTATSTPSTWPANSTDSKPTASTPSSSCSAASPRRPLPEDHKIDALAYRIQRLVIHQRTVDALAVRRGPTRPGVGLEF